MADDYPARRVGGERDMSINEVADVTVFILFAQDYEDDEPDEDSEYDDRYQGVFSTLEKAKRSITVDIDETLTDEQLDWQESGASLNGRKHYRTQMIRGSRYYIREALVDKSDWSDIFETLMSAEAIA